MGLDLYYLDDSPPCRSVLLTGKALNIEFNLIAIDLEKGEHKTPEYTKINPQQVVPTLNDNGFIIWESRAIIAYLVNKFGKDDSLYPKDPQKRAVVDHRLYFDIGTLYQRFSDYYYPVAFEGVDYNPAQLIKINDAFKLFDTILDGKLFAAGDSLTIADLTLVVTVSNYDALKYDLTPYKNVVRWYENIKKVAPGHEELNWKNALIFKAEFDRFVAKHNKNK